ncbi:polysaccharide biosynthesis C-terminal domain-containing protein, partial [Candidatus Kaiserbacteria bacterium]|nr:polysaccharide biosynthesis C-terminal domain-containing protein [Candidatus Kaiserbacteria bacterium]
AAGLFSIQAIAAWRLGFRFGPLASWRHSGVRQFVHLLLPRTLGQSVTQIDQFVNVPIATRIGPGNLTIFRLANDIQDAPISIIGVSMATVAFPVFIELLSQNRRQEFIEHFSKIVRQILFLIIPMTVLLLQLRAQVTRLVGGTHLVSWPSTITAAQTLGFFALSFFAQSLIPVLARSFYAMKDTKTPVRITIAAVGLDIVGSIVLGHLMGVKGLALSFTISNILNAGALLFVLRQRLGSLDDERMFQSVLRVMGVTILMALTVQAAKYFLVTFGLDLSRAVGVLAQAVVAGLVGVLSYMIFAALFRLEEASLITQALQAFRQMIVGQRPSNGQDAPTI